MSTDVKIPNGTWTDESLPEWKRKELLHDDLRRLRPRKAGGESAGASQAVSPAIEVQTTPAKPGNLEHPGAC